MKKLYILALLMSWLVVPQAWGNTGSEEAPLSVTELLERGVPAEPVAVRPYWRVPMCRAT